MSIFSKRVFPAKFLVLNLKLQRDTKWQSLWLFHLLIKSMTKSVFYGFKATIQKYFVRINIKINKTVSIECLFFDMIGPIKYHQAMQTNYHFLFNLTAQPGIGLTLSNNKHSMLKKQDIFR